MSVNYFNSQSNTCLLSFGINGMYQIYLTLLLVSCADYMPNKFTFYYSRPL